MLKVNHLGGFFGKRPQPFFLEVVGSTGLKGLYGMRLLTKTYSGSAVKVRRVSDDAEQDIGFSGESLDWSGAIAFKGASALKVVRWYDQSGGGNYLLQATSANQPELDTAGKQITFNGSTTYLASQANLDLAAATVTAFLVRQWADVSGTQMILEHGLLDEEGWAYYGVGTERRFQLADNFTTYNRKSNTTINTNLKLDSLIADKGLTGSSETEMYENGSTTGNTSPQTGNTSLNFASAALLVGARSTPELYFNGHVKELSVFASAFDNTRRGTAEANINRYYLIY